MGKQSKKNKKIQQKLEIQNKIIQKQKEKESSKTLESTSDSDCDENTINEKDFVITLETIKKLGKNLDILRTVQYKPIRAALFPLFEDKVKKEGNTANVTHKNLTNCISSALFDDRFDDAIMYLEEFYKRKATVKLGTVMRWVRDLNLCTIKPERQKVRTMYAILKCYPEFQGQENLQEDKTYFQFQNSEIEVEQPTKGELIRIQNWEPKELVQEFKELGENPYTEKDFKVICHEKAEDRKPPNQYDLDIFTTVKPIEFPSMLLPESERPKIERKEFPFVPGAFVMNNVLTPEDCLKIVQMSEAMGYRLDVPIGSENDFRAHGCVWNADEITNGYIFGRVKPYLSKFNGEGSLGLNSRWRLYKYNPGNVYRPHIDGAWPGSAIKDGKYVFDGYGDRYSKLTMVIYLTEGFNGGQTTFYTPSMTQKGCIESRGVSPRVGSILCFPHGEAAGALIHEGSAVFDSGRKYIIRTDVLYKND